MKVNATAAATSGSLDVTWSPPSPLDANGPVTGYTLNMTRVKFEGATESQSLSGDTVEFTKEGNLNQSHFLLIFSLALVKVSLHMSRLLLQLLPGLSKD